MATAKQQWKSASQAYRARRRAAAGIGMYLQARPLGVSAERAQQEEVQVRADLAALPVAPAPAGWDIPQDQSATFATKAEGRRRVLAIAESCRAELARRAAEREEYARLGLDGPRYIESDAILRDRPGAALHGFLAVVRGNPNPLSRLLDAEANLRVVAAGKALAGAWAGISRRDAA